jgi:hypothetical protein
VLSLLRTPHQLRRAEVARVLCIAGIFTLVGACAQPLAATPKPDHQTLRRELLAAHAEALAAHREGKWNYFGDSASDPFWTVNYGDVSAQTPDQQRLRFRAYLEGVRFHSYDDLQTPVVGISTDGSMGWVAVKVRMQGQTRESLPVPIDQQWAWLMVYERREGKWIAVANASNKPPAPWENTLADLGNDLEVPLRNALQAAQDSIGGPAAIASIRWLVADASVTSPRGGGHIRLEALANGNLQWSQRMDHGSQVQWAGNKDQARSWASTGETRELEATERATMVGHAFLLAVLAPQRLWTPRALGQCTSWRGQSCTCIIFSDALGEPVSIYYSATSHRILGVTLFEPGAPEKVPIEIAFTNWQSLGTLALPKFVELTHRDSTFTYLFESLALNQGEAPVLGATQD